MPFTSFPQGVTSLGVPLAGNGMWIWYLSASDGGSLTQIAARAHARGIKVIAATLSPFGGAGYYSASGETMRQTVNAFMRSGKGFDGVIDFDAVVKDPAHPETLLPKFDSGDHLHPNDDGYKAMAEAINLKLFEK